MTDKITISGLQFLEIFALAVSFEADLYLNAFRGIS